MQWVVRVVLVGSLASSGAAAPFSHVHPHDHDQDAQRDHHHGQGAHWHLGSGPSADLSGDAHLDTPNHPPSVEIAIAAVERLGSFLGSTPVLVEVRYHGLLPDLSNRPVRMAGAVRPNPPPRLAWGPRAPPA